MCYSIYRITSIMKLCIAAQQVQQLVDNGTLAEAFNKNRKGEAHECVTAFNLLAESVAIVADEHKEVSPFLRYRQEILGNYGTAAALRSLTMNLWGGSPCRLGALFMNADPHHTRIALECIAAYTQRGENDPHFMKLADDIRAMKQPQEESA